MSRIIYKPTCSNCGAVIHGAVSSSVWQYKGASSRGVSPTVCLNCGTYFDSIVMPCPTKEDFEIDMDLPYETRRVTMNHDYAHCMDYRGDCPMECFRARLTKEALDKHWAIVSWMQFAGTDECKRKDGRNEQAKIQEGQSDS